MTSATGIDLDQRLVALAAELRPPEVVCSPEGLGSSRLHRYSLNRLMLRRAIADAWQWHRTEFNLDGDGCGRAIYTVDTGSHRFSFVAFTTTFDENEHTDRVVADQWEITAALVEGDVDADRLAELSSSVPLQEAGRFDRDVLVLTRGNRSVRFFESVVEALSSGRQPDPRLVGDAAYLMRSTAFYGNGKYGMRSFEGLGDEHPLGAPYRAQFVAALLFRELGYDALEHCARVRGGEDAAVLDGEWRRYFGLGNATGLGLVPYAFNHPHVIKAWLAVRETALAEVRRFDSTAERIDRFRWWVDRAVQHFSTGSDDDCSPFWNPIELAEAVRAIRSEFERLEGSERAFDGLMRWAEHQHPEVSGMVASLLLELHEADDRHIDRWLLVDEESAIDPSLEVHRLEALIDDRYGWVDQLGLDDSNARAFWWAISDNTEEPRRVLRGHLAPRHNDVAIDVALRIRALRSTLDVEDAATTVADVVARHPEHRSAVERVLGWAGSYGEPRDNACSASFLPLQLQRFQLAMYGMDNFKPKSTDWLRVTLFQGAPRVSDLMAGTADDSWVFPPRPSSSTEHPTSHRGAMR